MKERAQGLIAGIVTGIIITGSIGVLAAQYTATENNISRKGKRIGNGNGRV